MTTTMTTTATTLCVHNLRLVDTEANAVAPIECAHLSNGSADCLANAKANAADAPV